MSLNPFTADPAVKERLDAEFAEKGAAITVAIEALIAGRQRDASDNLGGVIPKEEADSLVTWFDLSSIESLLLFLLPHAQKLARPPISGFTVGAVGLTAAGDVIMGGNLEFPGTHLGMTIHGEGFVFSRAFSRGSPVTIIATGEAHPCGHCRQFMSEFAATGDLLLIDPMGHRLRMSDLYPWPFDPAYLGETGAVPGTNYWPDLLIEGGGLDPELAARLLWAGKRSYAPYSKGPAAVVLTLADGNYLTGSTIESVAYNPTIGPLQAALIELFAHGFGFGDVVEATLAAHQGGAVDYAPATVDAIERLMPGVSFKFVRWARS